MPTIKKPNQHFDATTYTGTGSSLSVTNGGFQPDFVWIKSRSTAANHALMDSIRGVSKQLQSSTTNAESTNSAGKGLQSFKSGGLTLGQESDAVGGTNANGATYVGWQWKAGGASTVNTSGTISSNVSVNATAGFSIGTFTSPASGTCSVGHGLGVKPAMTIVKCRSVGNSGWFLWHQALGDNNTDYLSLQSTAAEASFSTMWGTDGRTSTLLGFTQGGSLEANATHVFYAWAEVEGYSKFGSYTGNGSADGPFVYTGFRPKFILIKGTASSRNWVVFDTSRNTYNLGSALARLKPNTSDAEDGNEQIDFLSNGFKLRAYTFDGNASGETYIYAAFAESPFKYSSAR